MGTWPATQSRIVTVDNELWRHWDEESTPTISVAQTVPASIAGIAVPPLGTTATEAISHAKSATAQLHARADAAPGVLGHLSAVLIRADAVASSQIEHITTSAEHLAVKLIDTDPADEGDSLYSTGTELVAANVAAALSAHHSHDDISVHWFHRLHQDLLASDRDLQTHHLGAWRDCAVWIGPNRATAEFEGPPHQQVASLMDDLIRFARRVDVHPVLHAAIAHAQFETIHPYVDGNGRIGRLLIHKLLPAGPAPVPVAHGLLNDPAKYVAGLNSYRAGDLDTWISIFAEAVTRAAATATRLVAHLDNIRNDYHRRTRTRRGSKTLQVIDMLLENPAITAHSIKSNCDVTPARASQILHHLADAEILRLSTLKAGRSQIWIAPEIIDAVEIINATTPRQPIAPTDAADTRRV